MGRKVVTGRRLNSAYANDSADQSPWGASRSAYRFAAMASFVVSAIRNGGSRSAVQAALLEVFDGAINLNPIMFRLFKNRSDGGREFWVRQRADRNADQRRQVVGSPIDR
jgi:hypothetical protein